MAPEAIVRDICPGGAGGEADIFVQIRNLFPGIGGTILTKQATCVALRKEFNTAPETGNRTFLRHLVMKKLDDFFCRSGLYLAPHIARPFGSISNPADSNIEASIYEWVWGKDGFSWAHHGTGPEKEIVMLDEWNEFTSAFSTAGINVGSDITDSDNGWVSKNIVHQYLGHAEQRLNLCWHRIDFGSSSLPINFEKLGRFLKDQALFLKQLLGTDRYELLRLAQRGLSGEIPTTGREWGRFEILVQEYRKSTLRHLGL